MNSINNPFFSTLGVKSTEIDFKFSMQVEEIITPIDNFIDPKIQEYLDNNNYFQNILDIVEDLKENGKDIEKNYHAIVGIGEIQDYYRNKDLQEKISLVLDEIIINLEGIEKSKKIVTENEEKFLDHIKRFINKRGLKNGRYSNFLEDKLQIIQNLSTKIVNNTKSIENKEGYEKIVSYNDIFSNFGLEEYEYDNGYFNSLEGFYGTIGVLQLTKGCSGKCRRCHVNALQRKKISTLLGWELLVELGKGYNPFTDNKKKLFFASDPFDWYGIDENNEKLNINDLISLFGGYEDGLFTKIPNNQESIEAFIENWDSSFGTRVITITKDNCDRLYFLFKQLYNENPDNFNGKKMFSIILKNGNYSNNFEDFFEFYEKEGRKAFGEMPIKLGKDYNYNNSELLHNVFSSPSFILNPDGIYNHQQVEISALYPEGHKDIKINNIQEYGEMYNYDLPFHIDMEAYDYLIGMILRKDSGKIVENKELISKYFKNNPSHKLFFKKKFEQLKSENDLKI